MQFWDSAFYIVALCCNYTVNYVSQAVVELCAVIL